jgi:hydroxyethylthiazole kinase-like uncharacterized protein yjeF
LALKKINWQTPLKLFDVAQTRQLEAIADLHNLSGYSLMEQAGLAVAQLAMAVKPFANCYWIFCGPGNNGGDGMEAAAQLHQRGQKVVVVLWQTQKRPADSEAALKKVLGLGIRIVSQLDSTHSISSSDLVIDALLGIGLRNQNTASENANIDEVPSILAWIEAAYQSDADVLAVDIPSGLNANTGNFGDVSLRRASIQAAHTLQLLNAKPGCFTASGRDACGTLWLDALGSEALQRDLDAAARLNTLTQPKQQQSHASHKGTFGDVAVVGGESVQVRGMGMTGAVDLAALAALHAGAGRVMACYLNNDAYLATRPMEVMARSLEALDLQNGVVVCGCGGGIGIRKVLPKVLQESAQLVLDADALNAIAQDPWLEDLVRQRAAKNKPTVITPHPLEAARLLKTNTAQVQNDRLQAAQNLAQQLRCTVVLKGSGTLIAQAGETIVMNPTGSARLATGGTGDVLAGVLGARMAQGLNAFEAACSAVYEHGQAADNAPLTPTLTARALAQLIRAPQKAS